MSNQGEFDWKNRIKYLLKESFEPKTYERYKQSVDIGLQDARGFIRASTEVIPSLDTISNIQSLGFSEVYESAGKFRAFGQEIAIGRDDARGAYYSQIPEELTLLSKQFEEQLEKSTTLEEKARAITFYHLRFVKIHPFLDGNGRTSRVIFDYQMEKLLDKRMEINYEHDKYIHGIIEAFATNKLSELTKTMTGVTLSKEIAKSQHPLALKEIVIKKEIPGGKSFKIPCGEDVETAQEVEIASLSPRLLEVLVYGKKVSIKLTESTSKRGALIDIDLSKEKEVSRGVVLPVLAVAPALVGGR